MKKVKELLTTNICLCWYWDLTGFGNLFNKLVLTCVLYEYVYEKRQKTLTPFATCSFPSFFVNITVNIFKSGNLPFGRGGGLHHALSPHQRAPLKLVEFKISGEVNILFELIGFVRSAFGLRWRQRWCWWRWPWWIWSWILWLCYGFLLLIEKLGIVCNGFVGYLTVIHRILNFTFRTARSAFVLVTFILCIDLKCFTMSAFWINPFLHTFNK